MKKLLRILAIVVAVASVTAWAALGANRGWTKTQAQVKTIDEVTGIEGVSYQKKFQPGLDFLAAALFGAGILAGASIFIRSKPSTNH